MEKQIIHEIKKFIGDMTAIDSMKSLRKSDYVRGYKDALDAIERIIDLGESLNAVAVKALEIAKKGIA